MHRTALPLCGFFLALIFTLVACSASGISSRVDYQPVINKFKVQNVKVLQIAKEARQSGDPMQLTRAVERLVPATNRLHAVAHSAEIADPEISALHNELLSAIDGYKGVLDSIAATIPNTPLPKSKIALRDALAAFNKGVAAWESSL
jgi:hypothetical protein